jgi:hypothetical protein
MAHQRIKHVSSNIAAASGTGVTKLETNNRPVRVLGYQVAPRAVDYAADVQINLMENYTGLSDEMLTFTGVEATHISAASYTSDFSTTADGWIELTNGSVVFTGGITAGTVVETLRLAAVADPDDASMQKTGLTTSGKYYKVLADFWAETAAGLDGSFVGLGANGDQWDEVHDHDAGHHPVITAENVWYTDQAMYGKADTTALQICVYTAKNGNTEDQIAVTKDLHFKNIRLYEIENVADWVPSAETHFGWCGADQSFSCDAGDGGTLTWTNGGGVTGVADGELFRASCVIDDWVATGAPMTVFGGTAIGFSADGTFTFDAESDGTGTVILTADATGDMDIEQVSVKKIQCDNTADAIYHSNISSYLVGASPIYTFPKPIYMRNGFYFSATSGGAACILDINVFYEIL